MNINLSASFKVLGKVDPIERKDGSISYGLAVMQGMQAGNITVPQNVYEAVEVGKQNTLIGTQKTYEGRTYISWEDVVPFKSDKVDK